MQDNKYDADESSALTIGSHIEGRVYAKENWMVKRRAATKAIFDCWATILDPEDE